MKHSLVMVTCCEIKLITSLKVVIKKEVRDFPQFRILRQKAVRSKVCYIQNYLSFFLFIFYVAEV